MNYFVKASNFCSVDRHSNIIATPEIDELFNREEFLRNPLILINHNQTQLGVGGSKNKGV